MSNRTSNVDFNKLPYKLMLSENELPKQWYNVRADMKNKPAPLLNPATMKPITFEELGFEGSGKAEYQRVANLMFEKVCELKYGAPEEKEI